MEELIAKSNEELSDLLKECELGIGVLQTRMHEIGAAMSEKRRLEDLKNKLAGITLDDIEKIKAQILSASPISSEESVHLN